MRELVYCTHTVKTGENNEDGNTANNIRVNLIRSFLRYRKITPNPNPNPQVDFFFCFVHYSYPPSRMLSQLKMEYVGILQPPVSHSGSLLGLRCVRAIFPTACIWQVLSGPRPSTHTVSAPTEELQAQEEFIGFQFIIKTRAAPTCVRKFWWTHNRKPQ